MWRHYAYIIISSICLMLIACDHIADVERIYDPLVKETPADGGSGSDGETQETIRRVVLLEDFTGQRCVNCPKATDVIDLMHDVFGNDVVAVGIHSGPLGFAGNARVVGLATATGDEYYNHWHLEYQPVGLINRQGPVNYLDWSTAVKEELTKPAPLRLEGTAVLVDDIITIQIKAEGKDGTVAGKLQVWLLEDGITALQLMPDGSANQTYVHNHVFRTAVNGTWGEDFSVGEGETAERTMTQTMAANWNPEQLSVVAFVYNDSGVQQTVKITVEH